MLIKVCLYIVFFKGYEYSVYFRMQLFNLTSKFKQHKFLCAKKEKETYKVMSSFGLDQQRFQRRACVAAFQCLRRFFLRAIQSDAPVIVYFARIFAFLMKPVFKTELGDNPIAAEGPLRLFEKMSS